MIRYFCYFGDSKVGIHFKKLIFDEGKLNSFFEKNLNKEKYGDFLEKILIRIFLDGEVEQYPQIGNNTKIFSKKDKSVVVNYHLLKNESKLMNEHQVRDYLSEITLNAIDAAKIILQNKGYEFNGQILKNDVLDLLSKKVFYQ